MNPGRFNNVIKFYNHTKSADGYGGYTSTTSSLIATLWGAAVETSGEIITQEGKRVRNKQVEIFFRKKDFDLITYSEFTFTVDDVGRYRVNNWFEIVEDEYIKLIGTYEI
jgi:head-tail adaptor